jgi:hypothetical protein
MIKIKEVLTLDRTRPRHARVARRDSFAWWKNAASARLQRILEVVDLKARGY